MAPNIITVDPPFGHKDMGQAVKQSEIGFWLNSVMTRGGHCSFGFPRVDNNNLGTILVSQHSLPKDWMSYAKIRADQNEHIGFLKIHVSVRGCIESECLFV